MADEASLTLREARARYFAANGLPADGGYRERWVRAPIGPIPFAFPNTAGRRRVTPAHDLHHVLTAYATDIRGEGELAAWEIGAGVRDRSALQLELRVLGFALVALAGADVARLRARPALPQPARRPVRRRGVPRAQRDGAPRRDRPRGAACAAHARRPPRLRALGGPRRRDRLGPARAPRCCSAGGGSAGARAPASSGARSARCARSRPPRPAARCRRGRTA